MAAIIFEPGFFEIDRVDGREDADLLVDDIALLFGREAGEGGIPKDPPVEMLHQKEGRPDDRFIFFEIVNAGDRDVCITERVKDAVLTFDLMSGREELSGRLLPKHEASFARPDKIGRVRLTALEFADGELSLELGESLE